MTPLLSKQNLEMTLNSLKREIDTRLIKETFSSFFQNTNYDVYTILQDDTENLVTESTEWLFDMIVTKEMLSEIEGQRPYLVQTILALESEICQGFNGVMYDFLKLLVCNSKYKVIVFRCHSSEINTYFNFMIKNIKTYRTSNGIFFLIGYLNDQKKYAITEVNTNGRFKKLIDMLMIFKKN